MRALLALALLPAPAAALPLDCRFEAACVEAGACTDLDRRARLLPAGGDGARFEMGEGRIAGSFAPFDALRLFDGQEAGLRLLLGIAADGTARLMAMETDPLRIATYFGRCEEA